MSESSGLGVRGSGLGNWPEVRGWHEARAPSPEPRPRLLSVTHLTTGFDQGGRFVPAVIDVSFSVGAGRDARASSASRAAASR